MNRSLLTLIVLAGLLSSCNPDHNSDLVELSPILTRRITGTYKGDVMIPGNPSAVAQENVITAVGAQSDTKIRLEMVLTPHTPKMEMVAEMLTDSTFTVILAIQGPTRYTGSGVLKGGRELSLDLIEKDGFDLLHFRGDR